MKWLFLVNNADFLFEFLGKVSRQLINEGDECLAVIHSKISEYERMKFFPKEVKRISKVDWCLKNYDSNKKEFGDLSWRELYIIYDRFSLYKYDYEKSLEIISQFYQFLEDVLLKEKPDAVVGEAPAGLFGQIAYYFCKKNNIVFHGLVESRIAGRIDIYDLEWTDLSYEKTFHALTKENILPEEKTFAKNFIENFIDHKTIYASYFLCKVRFSPLEFIAHYVKRLKESGSMLLRYFIERRNFKNFDYESDIIFKQELTAPFRTIKRNFKFYLQKKVFNKPDPKDTYFFFPLQYEPEASTLVLATYYSNQLATIKNVAMTLPLPHKLYLKEHPGSIGARANNFYKEIKKIPNAVLLSSEESTPAIIAGSMGVITMTSTVGMEAAMAGKSVYVLGNVFYSYHPLCRKIVNFDDLKNKIKEDQKTKPENLNLENDNIRFIVSYVRNNIAGNIFIGDGTNDKNDYKLICRSLREMTRKHGSFQEPKK